MEGKNGYAKAPIVDLPGEIVIFPARNFSIQSLFRWEKLR